MKTLQHRIVNLLGALVLGTWMASPASIMAQETAPRAGPTHAQLMGVHQEDGPQNRIMRDVMKLHRTGKHDEARRMAERARGGDGAGMQRQHHGANAAGVSPLRVKMQQLRQASELLQAAGFQELADKTRKEIGRLEEQARRESGGNHANDEMREEMKRMRREMEELRNQLRKLKEQAAPKHEAAPAQEQD
jgi:hypothetical protein